MPERTAMTSAAAQPAMPIVIPVRLFGMDSEGKPFIQLATARNLTREQAVLDRVEQRLAPGAVIGLQYQESKTRIRVLWACELDGTFETQLGIQLIDSRDCPWAAFVKDSAEMVAGGSNRRRFQRHRLSIGMELSDPVSGQKLRARSTDVSIGGCYIETILPLAVGTRLEIEMWIDPSKVSATALVRTCDPGVGMVIVFIGVSR